MGQREPTGDNGRSRLTKDCENTFFIIIFLLYAVWEMKDEVKLFFFGGLRGFMGAARRRDLASKTVPPKVARRDGCWYMCRPYPRHPRSIINAIAVSQGYETNRSSILFGIFKKIPF